MLSESAAVQQQKQKNINWYKKKGRLETTRRQQFAYRNKMVDSKISISKVGTRKKT